MSPSFVVFLCLSTLLAFSQAEGYIGYKIYEITPATDAQCALLAELAKQDQIYDFFTLSKLPAHPARVMVPPQTTAVLELYLQQHKMAYKILTDNYGAEIEREFEVNQQLRMLSPNSTAKGRLSTARYYTHTEINNYMDDLAQLYAERVSVEIVGKSHEGRVMKAMKITNGDGRTNKPVILVDAGFHGNEWMGISAAAYAMGQLVQNYAANADLLKNNDWIVLPVVNPDGYEYSQKSPLTRLWRKTRQQFSLLCYGTDPNRNFDFHWKEVGASSNPCSVNYAGPSAFSEKETVIVRDIILKYGPVGVFYLTLHSFGTKMMYPWGYTSELPPTWQDMDDVARTGADAIRAATGTNYEVGTSPDILYPSAGTSKDYSYAFGFKVSLTLELPPGGLTGFDPPASSIDKTVKETFVGIRAMGKRVIEKYPLTAN